MSARVKARAKPKQKTEAKKPRTKVVRKKPPAAKAAKPTPKSELVQAPVAEKPSERVFLLVVRLQGTVAVPYDLEKALWSMNLHRRFNAVVLEKNEASIGMLRKVKDYVTWGEISADDIAALLNEKGEVASGSRVNDSFVKERFAQQSVRDLAVALTRGQVQLSELWQKGVRKVFRLRPPSGGFVSNIKRPFTSHGELGYRGKGIASLVSRMM